MEKRQYCAKSNEKNIDQIVHLYGWVDTIRDHGSLLFIHIRDISGVIQIVFDKEKEKNIYEKARTLHNEYVIEVQGKIKKRETENINAHLPTGQIEVEANKLTILNTAKTPPFMITEKSMYSAEETKQEFNVDEDLRLQYRFLDLRRPSMQKNLIARHNVLKIIRNFCADTGFFELETPILTKSTPEGARDFLVPSRAHPHNFYALPQSPQLFKQLLMMSGFDKYFQIVKCFRDEDLRPNRQPEFTQLDLEASFIDEEYIYTTIESLLVKLFESQNKSLKPPFLRMTYKNAIENYGNDHPDLRFDLKLHQLTKSLKNTNYKILNTIANQGGLIIGLNIKNKADQMSKSMLQEELAKKAIAKCGGKGLTWMKVQDNTLQSNVVQFFSKDEQAEIMSTLNAENNDVLILIADQNPKKTYEIAGRFRLYIAEKLNLIDPTKICPCWITDFPMMEESDGKLTAVHHPFTQPQEDITKLKNKEDILNITARAYDIVINGEEIGGGSIRIHNPKTQERIFELLNLTKQEISDKFGFFINALEYGTPPHGGIALGIDRLISMLVDENSIRQVITFPKNRAALCPLTQAPNKVSNKQLEDINIKLTLLPKKDPQ